MVEAKANPSAFGTDAPGIMGAYKSRQAAEWLTLLLERAQANIGLDQE
jgi:hypothetical protein